MPDLLTDLGAAAERVAPPVPADLPDRVLARLDEPSTARRRVVAIVAVAATVLAGLGLSPQVRAFAADVLGLVGISVTTEEPDASPTPDEPLPRSRESDLDRAADLADFPLGVPTLLGEPDSVEVADRGRVVTMSWDDGHVVLDEFAGTYGPVFEKQIGAIDPVPVDVGDARGWWIDGPHDLMYVDRDGDVLTATARLAGRTLLWEEDGVSFRLEGRRLTRAEAVEIAGTTEPPAG